MRDKPLYLLLLPLFFVFHGYRENYDFVPVPDALKLTGIYLFTAAILFLAGWMITKNLNRAGLIAFCILGFHFFFGSIHDGLKSLSANGFISRYSFILPLAVIVLAILIFCLVKKKPRLRRLTVYMNLLFIFLLLIDAAWLAVKIQRTNTDEQINLPEGFSRCDTCQKPDVYFIIADEYAGNKELSEVFYFDNSEFTNALAARGFHTVPYSFSNYNYTPFSIASALNMEYLQLSGKIRTRPDVTYCFDKIRHNNLLRFLKNHGYSFYNFSFFDFEGQPARVRETFLPAKTRLITGQTLLSRIDRDIRFNLVTRFKSESELRRLTFANKENNQNIINLTLEAARKKINNPKFIFTHLMMPHYPYYYDKNGNERPFELLTEGNQVNQEHYIEYLQYCNKRFLSLIDELKTASATPPVIIFMGDHGFRHFTKPVSEHYYFLNHSSVHLPTRQYSAFKDTTSAINFCRSILNSAFAQKLPLLKDSTSYLAD